MRHEVFVFFGSIGVVLLFGLIGLVYGTLGWRIGEMIIALVSELIEWWDRTIGDDLVVMVWWHMNYEVIIKVRQMDSLKLGPS